jgi:hypothetical protein
MQTKRLAGRGDDLLPGERPAAALDELQVGVGLVRPVHVEGQLPGGVEVVDRDAVALHALR